MKLKEFIKKIRSRQILTSRGHPTVEVDFITEFGIIRSSVPSGASTGHKEAYNKIDNNKSYLGRSVMTVVKDIREKEPVILDSNPINQNDFDKFLNKMDGTPDKSNLGANFILPLSICFCKLAAFINHSELFQHIADEYSKKAKLPIPNFNVINGGMHSGNNLSCQEIMVCFNKQSYSANLEATAIFYERLKETIKNKYGSIYQGVGDEGGFSPPISSIGEGIELLLETGESSGENEFKIALDLAANSFYKNGKYKLDDNEFTTEELVDYYCKLINKYPQIYSIEDPFAEDDLEGWSSLFSKVGDRINIVADDLTVSNEKLVVELFEKNLFNTVLIKPNQIGSVTEVVKAFEKAKKLNCKIMVSHRSAETDDTFICHLAVGLGAEYIKCGAPCRGERVGKYNELLRIEEYF